MTKYRIMVSTYNDNNTFAIQRKVWGMFWIYEQNVWLEDKLIFDNAKEAKEHIKVLKQIRYKPKWEVYHHD